MILPLNIALPVSQRSIGDVFGESFISMKDVHSLKSCQNLGPLEVMC